VLETLTEQVRTHAVDVVIVAGDVFDSATPAAACYTLLSETLRALADTGAQVIVTSGNHDSAARLGFQAALLRDGIHVRTDPAAIGEPITVSDEHGPVHFYGIPSSNPRSCVRCGPGCVRRPMRSAARWTSSAPTTPPAADGRWRSRTASPPASSRPPPRARHPAGRTRRRAAVGLRRCRLRRPRHIHGRQKLAAHVRYAGAPLHYSFGEGHKPRGSWLIELDAEGAPRRCGSSCRCLDASSPCADPSRRSWPTSSDDARDAWVSVEYTDDLPVRDPLRRLQQRFPYCAKVVHVPDVARHSDGRGYTDRVRAARSDLELFDAFLSHVRDGEGLTEREREVLRDVLEERVVVEALA
jgi:exonuclease SbcD